MAADSRRDVYAPPTGGLHSDQRDGPTKRNLLGLISLGLAVAVLVMVLMLILEVLEAMGHAHPGDVLAQVFTLVILIGFSVLLGLVTGLIGACRQPRALGVSGLFVHGIYVVIFLALVATR